MARYIDADALIRLIKIDALSQFGYTERDAIYCIKATPTVDVVPKSEVEEYKHNWQKIHDSYTADCLEHYNRGRTEVAREIFAELHQKRKELWDNGYKMFECWCVAEEEIEKKYTEIENG